MMIILELVRAYTEDVAGKLGTKKCANLNIRIGKYKNATNIEPNISDVIRQLEITGSYKIQRTYFVNNRSFQSIIAALDRDYTALNFGKIQLKF